jgi:DNA-binding transcriptional ArsR family regulator
VDRIEALNAAPIPAWLKRYADGDPALLRDLDRALRAFHAACLAPQWPSVTARFHRDVAERMALMRRHGVIAVLSTLSPDLRLRGLTLEGRYPWDRRVCPTGRGLVLMPSAFWTGHPLITWDPQDRSRHVLIYPARGAPAQAFGHGPSPHQAEDSLAMLIGTTRSYVLRALREPRTTTGLARHIGISPSSASDHAATLRAAGLVTSERHGQAVVHQISELGTALLWHD